MLWVQLIWGSRKAQAYLPEGSPFRPRDPMGGPSGPPFFCPPPGCILPPGRSSRSAPGPPGNAHRRGKKGSGAAPPSSDKYPLRRDEASAARGKRGRGHSRPLINVKCPPSGEKCPLRGGKQPPPWGQSVRRPGKHRAGPRESPARRRGENEKSGAARGQPLMGVSFVQSS